MISTNGSVWNESRTTYAMTDWTRRLVNYCLFKITFEPEIELHDEFDKMLGLMNGVTSRVQSCTSVGLTNS